MVILFEYLSKITAGTESGLHSYLQDTFIRITQKFLCLLQAQGNHEFHRCFTKACLEQT